MISEKILDEILPVKGLEELKNEKINELQEEGFIITNFQSGGIFYHLLLIVCQIRLELVLLLRNVLNNMFVTHAQESWLELKAADYSKKRKEAVKTRGYITLNRTQTGEPIKISKGYVFKTDRDINGNELRFIVLNNMIIPKDSMTGIVEVEAEKAGAEYNVSPGQINKCLIHLDGIDQIENKAGWIIREGADIEDYESLRSRTLGSWSELSALPIRDKYKNVCESVPGVLYVNVHDQHPRGQGTVDIVVTGTAATATEELLEKVRQAADSIKGPYDDVLVKSSSTVSQDIEVVLVADAALQNENLEKKALIIIEELLQIQKNRSLNELYRADIIVALKNELPLKNVKVIIPAEDIQLDTDKIIVCGDITVKVQKV